MSPFKCQSTSIWAVATATVAAITSSQVILRGKDDGRTFEIIILALNQFSHDGNLIPNFRHS